MGRHALDRSGSGHGHVAGSCEWVNKPSGNFLTSWGPVSFSERPLLNGVSYLTLKKTKLRSSKFSFWNCSLSASTKFGLPSNKATLLEYVKAQNEVQYMFTAHGKKKHPVKPFPCFKFITHPYFVVFHTQTVTRTLPESRWYCKCRS